MAFLKQRWIPMVFVLSFLVVVAVNAILIVTATGSFSGLVVAHPYKKGAEYTQLRQELAKQQALHWAYQMWTERQADGSLSLVTQWTDGDRLGLVGLAITAEISRPVENLPPIRLALEELGGGRYAAIVALPRAGQWDVRLEAVRGERHFRAAERLQVR